MKYDKFQFLFQSPLNVSGLEPQLALCWSHTSSANVDIICTYYKYYTYFTYFTHDTYYTYCTYYTYYTYYTFYTCYTHYTYYTCTNTNTGQMSQYKKPEMVS